jgi:hypothetical protein
MRHPAEFYVKFLLIDEPPDQDPQPRFNAIMFDLQERGFLAPAETYLPMLWAEIADVYPEVLEPRIPTHRASVNFLRAQQVYEFFNPNEAMNGAWTILKDPEYRLAVEQALMGRLTPKQIAYELNRAHKWHLTEEGVAQFGHCFWNVKLLTFDDWGRFLYGRTALYERHMALLSAPAMLTLHHLGVEQQVESKAMIEQAQKQIFFTFMELAQKPGTDQAKVKGMAILNKAMLDSHEALSTSDMQLKDVLKNFEKFRIQHNQPAPKSIHELAPEGNYTGSGVQPKETENVPG